MVTVVICICVPNPCDLDDVQFSGVVHLPIQFILLPHLLKANTILQISATIGWVGCKHEHKNAGDSLQMS